MKRVKKGILGGTFDPIHNGHLMLAREAYVQLQLDEVVFLPAGHPPHKPNRSGATDAQRLAMLRLALAKEPGFTIDEQELHRGGPSYTKDTLWRMKEREPETDLYFIIGGDSLMAFDTWFHPELICKTAHLVAFGRDGLTRCAMEEKVQQLRCRFGGDFLLLDTVPVPVSSTSLRCGTEVLSNLVPAAVADYIRKNRVYGG